MASVFQIIGAEWFAFFIAICLIGVVALVLVALWVYRDAQSRRMDAGVWLVLLILATLVAGIIGLVIVLLIYVVVRESHPVGAGMIPPYGPYPVPVVPAACPVCGRPMTWYPQYQRWYCPSCGQYR